MESKHKIDVYRKVISALYLAALAVMLIMIIANITLKNPKGADPYGLDGFLSISEEWTTQDGSNFDTAEIDSLRDGNSDHVSIFYHVPGDITQDQSIVFRSKNCVTTVLVDGSTRYTSELSSAPFYNHSPGTRWNLITIHPDDAGKVVELQVHQAYQDGRAKVDNFYFGDRADIVLNLISEKLWGCVIALVILFVAVIYLVTWAILNWRRTEKDNSLLWLSVFAMAASCWCLLETNVFQLFWDGLRQIQVVDNMMLVVAGMSLYLYLDSTYGAFRSRIVRILCGLDMAYIIFATVSQIAGAWDYHQTLNGAVITYGIVVVILIVCLVKQGQRARKNNADDIPRFYLLQHIGVLLLGLGLFGDLVRYLNSDVLDRALCMRLGFLGFIISFGAGNIYHMILLVEKGRQAEFISLLAYEDGLTKSGNRTAYLEQRQKLIAGRKEQQLTYVMFDINNLKNVNDTLGHKAGDELLVKCADVLVNAFPKPWKLYRTGGDEFVALYSGSDGRAKYEAASTDMLWNLKKLNDGHEMKYEVSIAHGVSFCEAITEETFCKAEEEADRRMYKNKYLIKYGAVSKE